MVWACFEKRRRIRRESAILRVGDNRANFPNANSEYAATSRYIKSYESAILRVGDNRANIPNANCDYLATSRDVKSYESAILRVGDNRANLPNANIDYATTSRYVKVTNPPFRELTGHPMTGQRLYFRGDVTR